MKIAATSKSSSARFITAALAACFLFATGPLAARAADPEPQKPPAASEPVFVDLAGISNYQPYWRVADTSTRDTDAGSFPYGDVLYQDRKGDYHRIDNGQYASQGEIVAFKARQDSKPLIDDVSLIDEKLFEPKKAYLYDQEFRYGEVAIGGYEAAGSYQAGQTTYTDQYGVTHPLFGLKGELRGELNAVKITGHTDVLDLGAQAGLPTGMVTTKVESVIQADVGGKAEGVVGVTNLALEAHGEIGVDATVKAGFEMPTTINLWGVKVTGSLEGDVRAGAAAGAAGEFHFGLDGFTLGGKAYAAWGVGGGIAPKISIDYSAVTKEVVAAWPQIKQTVEATGEELKERVYDIWSATGEKWEDAKEGAGRAADAVGDAVKAVPSVIGGYVIDPWWNTVYYGHYCGPDWTACQYKSKDPAQWCLAPYDGVSGVDAACRRHDWAYSADDPRVKLFADLALMAELIDVAETGRTNDAAYWVRIWKAFELKIKFWDPVAYNNPSYLGLPETFRNDFAKVNEAIREGNLHKAEYFVRRLVPDLLASPEFREAYALYKKQMEELERQYGKDFGKCDIIGIGDTQYSVDLCAICKGEKYTGKPFSCPACGDNAGGECPPGFGDGPALPDPGSPEILNPWKFD